MSEDTGPLDASTMRMLWFVPLWYLSFTTALMDLSKPVVIGANAVIIGAAFVVGGYSSCDGDQT